MKGFPQIQKSSLPSTEKLTSNWLMKKLHSQIRTFSITLTHQEKKNQIKQLPGWTPTSTQGKMRNKCKRCKAKHPK